MTARTIALAAALFASIAPVRAQPPARAPQWQMDWDERHCTLVRLPGADAPFFVDFQTTPGSFITSLRVTTQDNRRRIGRVTSVALLPSGQSFDVVDEIDLLRRGRAVVGIGDLPESFWDALAGSTALELRRGETLVQRVPLPSVAAAVRAARQCVSAAMTRWGLDEAALRSMRQTPRSTNMMGITANDFPDTAVGASGRTVIRVTVGVEGRATACATLVSAGHPALDEAACRAVMRRGLFSPALDANGQPAAATFATSVLWATRR